MPKDKGAAAQAVFTPGPWVVYDEKDRYPGIDGIDGTCTIVTWGDETDSEAGVRGYTPAIALANARLIAAAPDLYEALHELADLVDAMRDGSYAPDSFTTQPARTALAKAEGRSDPKGPSAIASDSTSEGDDP